MRAWTLAVLTVAAVIVAVAPATATLTSVAAASCGAGSCNGVTPMPWGWRAWAQQTTGTPSAPQQGGSAQLSQAGGGNSAAGGSAAGTDPCSYTSAGPGLVAQWCPSYTTLGTRGAKLIPVGPGAPVHAAVSAPRITPLQLAERAVQQLVVPLPQVLAAPPRGSDGAVGLPEWFWLPAGQWSPLTKQATAGPVWAQVTAHPQAMTVDPGDGTGALTCPGPATPYNPGAPASAQHSDCSYLYQDPSTSQPGLAYQVTVTVTWTATWRGSQNTGGTLAPLTRSVTFGVRIAEGQALIPAGS